MLINYGFVCYILSDQVLVDSLVIEYSPFFSKITFELPGLSTIILGFLDFILELLNFNICVVTRLLISYLLISSFFLFIFSLLNSILLCAFLAYLSKTFYHIYLNYIDGSFIIYKSKFLIIYRSLTDQDKLDIFNKLSDSIYKTKLCPVNFNDLKEGIIGLNNPELLKQFFLNCFKEAEQLNIAKLIEKPLNTGWFSYTNFSPEFNITTICIVVGFGLGLYVSYTYIVPQFVIIFNCIKDVLKNQQAFSEILADSVTNQQQEISKIVAESAEIQQQVAESMANSLEIQKQLLEVQNNINTITSNIDCIRQAVSQNSECLAFTEGTLTQILKVIETMKK